MALPSNTFMFNYNAREYVPSTRTFPKTTGQLFDENLVLNADPAEVGKYYVDFTGKELYMRKMFSTTGDNPFNVTSTNPNLTFVCKTSDFSSSSANIFVSRSTATTHNCLIRGDRIILNTDYGVFVPTNNPQFIAITINSNGVLVRKELDASGNVITSVTDSSIEFRNGSNGIAFFRGYADNSKEYFQNRFYWMYLSRETLTDEEILQVINHNEPKPIKIPYNNLYRNGVNLNYQDDTIPIPVPDWDFTFRFNFNAKLYNEKTHTIPNIVGALEQKDLVITGGTQYIVKGYDYLDFTGLSTDYRVTWDFGTSGNNPYVFSNTGNSGTIIYCFQPTETCDLISCRDAMEANWFIHSNGSYLAINMGGNYKSGVLVQEGRIIAHIIYGDGLQLSTRYSVTNGTNIGESYFLDTKTIGGTNTRYLHFFGDNNECQGIKGRFKWCFFSNEALTVEKINKVISYNQSI